MTIEQIKLLQYVGGGYFRIPNKKLGEKSPTIHGPDLLELFHKYIQQQEKK